MITGLRSCITKWLRLWALLLPRLGVAARIARDLAAAFAADLFRLDFFVTTDALVVNEVQYAGFLPAGCSLDAVRRGFEDGFRQRSRARTNASPRAQHQEEMLRKISSWWLGMIRVVQAARAAAFAIGLLVLIDAAAVAQPAAQGPPAVG